MAKAAVVVLADIETHEGLGRVVNAMETAKEFKENGDPVSVVFDGAGTRWIGELARSDHNAHQLYLDVKDVISGACAYCAAAFHARDAIRAEQIPLLEEFDRHPSLHKLVADGYQVITF